NELAEEVRPEDLASRDTLLEFYVHPSEVEDGLVAQNVRLVQD
ncbi:MAG: hypothetical protein RLZ44_1109, partial [Pseudomonadota bacterium]